MCIALNCLNPFLTLSIFFPWSLFISSDKGQADTQSTQECKQNHCAEFVLHVIKAVKALPMAQVCSLGTGKHQANAHPVGQNGQQAQGYFDVKPGAGRCLHDQQATRYNHGCKGGNFYPHIHTLVQVRQHQFMRTPPTEQGTLKQGFGQNTTEPKPNKQEMKK